MIRHSSHRLFDDEPESARNGYDSPRARRSSPGDSTGAAPVPVWCRGPVRNCCATDAGGRRCRRKSSVPRHLADCAGAR